jgi:hypothetical protein
MHRFLAATLMICALPLASAAANESRYTSVALAKCKKFDRVVVADTEIESAHVCPGLAGYVVTVGDADLRTFVSIGKTRAEAQRQPASQNTFSPFNSVNDNLEWRIDVKTKQPFATIQRWTIADSENPGKDGTPPGFGLMVVTRILPTCHVAYIDVRANENPNELARKAADELAATFDCAKDAVRVIGKRGRAIELSGAPE